ncbi:keratin, type I cytoskeletal 19 [Xenopus laevis]|uniref:IF rod domain-containing protein n=2 Tax=Xenopus laevis TaxID=8355 RepID=A0A974H0E9_XENLA|nr:keratin, type I cytoskeletal 19 [Xenopus laevis]OCT59866.1 hypothetical protein XELAEV_18045884mg [Xenopus laevis]
MTFNSNFHFSSSSFNESFSQVRISSSSSSSHGASNGIQSRISKPISCSSSSGAFDYTRDFRDTLTTHNGKETMQNLNDRLASYLEKVRSLEEANTGLETKIQEWHKNRAQKHKRDYSMYERTIAELQSQLLDGHMNGAKIKLQMENAKLAHDAFKRKYDTEKTIRTALEDDLESLRRAMDNLTIVRTDLEMEVEGMRKELIYMRMGHEEDMKLAQFQKKGSSVDVKVDAPPSVDLAKTIADIRKEYEALIEKSRKDSEDWYSKQSSTVKQEVRSNTEALQSSRNQIKDLKRTLQTLEIELQGEMRRKHGLEGTLAETQANSTEQLQKMQSTICRMEAELSNVRDELERQNIEYRALLDIKTRLENEIATYRELLEGNKMRGRPGSSEGANRKITTLVQDMVNGRVISTKVSEIPKKL